MDINFYAVKIGQRLRATRTDGTIVEGKVTKRGPRYFYIGNGISFEVCNTLKIEPLSPGYKTGQLALTQWGSTVRWNGENWHYLDTTSAFYQGDGEELTLQTLVPAGSKSSISLTKDEVQAYGPSDALYYRSVAEFLRNDGKHAAADTLDAIASQIAKF